MSGSICPICTSSFPIYSEPFIVRHRVLNYQRLDPLRVGERHAKPNRSTVVLHVDVEAPQPNRLCEMLRDGCDSIESVGKPFWVGPIAVTKTRVIRRHEVELIRQPGEQRLEHSRRRG